MPERRVSFQALFDIVAGKFLVDIGNVSYVIARQLGVDRSSHVAKKLGVSPQAVHSWDVAGKLPPLQAIRLHRDHGVPMSVLEPLVEGRT